MKKLLFIVVIAFVLTVAISIVTVIFAQEQKPMNMENKQLIILGGLKLKESANPEEAEKLMKDDLVTKMTGIKGVKFRILKKAKMEMGQVDDPSAKDSDKASFDYIMMAEIDDFQTFMQFMHKSYRGERGLSVFGSSMKGYAGEPYINSYEVIAEAKEIEETK